MAFNSVNKITPIGAMKTFTKPNCNLCMEEHLTISKTTWQTRYAHEQEFGDIRGLPKQNDCSLIFLSTYDPV